MNQPYIIAELGINHNGNINTAREMVRQAKACGCSAVKIQFWTPQEFTTNTDELWNTFQDNKTTKEMADEVFKMAEELEIDCFGTPTSIEGAVFLSHYEPPYMKIGSDDTDNYYMLKQIARLNIPMILSTGMSSEKEVEKAVESIRSVNPALKIIIMLCSSKYPAQCYDYNENTLLYWLKKYHCSVGVSDHMAGNEFVYVMTSNGATFFEKHFTLDRSQEGQDHHFSVDPEGMTDYVQEIKNKHIIYCRNHKVLREDEKEEFKKYKKSLWTKTAVKKNEEISEENLIGLRPGSGISVKHYEKCLRGTFKRNIQAGVMLDWNDIGGVL